MSDFMSRDAGRLVEMAALRAELERRREAQAQSEVRPRPVVTVSREYGALGAAIAREVAARLGFECWDRELVEAVATGLDRPAPLLEALDERHHSMVLELLAALLHKDEVGAGEYREELVTVIRAIAKRGSAVIVGRGGQLVVPPRSALRVRVIAPLSARVDGIARRHGLSREAAERRVHEVDRERAAFMKKCFDGALEATDNYDLVLDSSSFGVEGSAALIERAYRIAFERPGEET
jgi:cytidylate kinase